MGHTCLGRVSLVQVSVLVALSTTLFPSVQSQTAHYDVVNPIITSGPESSLYGYSVALHSNGNQKYAIVGAPDSDVFPAVLRNRGVSKPGAVYKCQLRSASVATGECQQIAIARSADAVFRNGSKREVKSKMRLGASVMSEGADGRVVACAPSYKTVWYHPKDATYKNGQEIDDAVGRCYILPKNLGTDSVVTFSPCDNIPNYRRALSSLFNTWLRFCLVGTAIDITRKADNHDQMVVSAPGRELGVGQLWTGDLNVTNVLPRTTGLLWQYNYDNYTGFAVAQGDFDGDGGLEVAMSQPIYGNRKEGGVLVVSSDATVTPSQDIFNRVRNEYVHLVGAYMGESFGYALSAVDVSNDGLVELLVGAPLARSSSISRSVYETGHVYIFSGTAMQSAVTRGKANNPPVILNASAAAQTLLGEAQAWFGAAISPLGDINNDGFNDVAVGAPYETVEGNPQGAVYIYLGSANGLVTQFIQRISSEELSTSNTFSGFGFSVGRGLDFDGNNYNDLIIGSPFTSNAVVLRARPTVSARFSISKLSQSAGDCVVDGTTVRCVNISVCGQLTAGVLKHGRATYSVQLQTPDVLSFDHQNAFIDEATVTVVLRNTQPGQARKCQSQTLFLTANKQTCSSTSVTLMSWELQAEDSTVTELTAVENLPVPKQTPQTIAVTLAAECATCVPDLRVGAVSLATLNQESQLVVGRDTQLLLGASVTNVGTKEVCTATVTVFLGKHVSFNRLQNAGGRQCAEDNDARTVTCQLPAGQAKNVAAKFAFVLNVPADLDVAIEEVDVRVGASPDSSQKADKNSATRKTISVVRRASIEVSADATSSQLELRKDTPQKPTLQELGPELKHDMKVNNVGPSQVPSSEVVIRWPASLRTGSDFLYLTSVTSSDKKTRCNATQLVNHRSISSPQPPPDNVLPLTGATTLKFNQARKCAGEGPVCYITILCSIPEMAAGATTVVSLTWRVYSSLSEDERLEYPITANTSVTLTKVEQAQRFTLETSKRPKASTSTSLYAVFERISEGVKWWVILLAVLAGVLILALCILILCKCGFFKRKRAPSQ